MLLTRLGLVVGHHNPDFVAHGLRKTRDELKQLVDRSGVIRRANGNYCKSFMAKSL